MICRERERYTVSGEKRERYTVRGEKREIYAIRREKRERHTQQEREIRVRRRKHKIVTRKGYPVHYDDKNV